MKLLVAIDLSEQSRKIIDEAQKLAKRLQATVVLLHVIAPASPAIELPSDEEIVHLPDIEPDDEGGRESIQLQSLAKQLQEDGIETSVAIVHHEEALAIIGESEKQQADLIMLGSHGHGALFHLLVGSVSEGVIRRSTCPVIIVPLKRP